jgi:hypothetical protein
VKKNKQIIYSLGILSTLFGFSVYAEAPLPKGWYAEGNVGYSNVTGKTYPTISTVRRTGVGWSAFGGYKFTPYVAAEGGYTGYKFTQLRNSVGTTIAKDSHYVVDVTSKIMLPVYETGINLFGKLGVAFIYSKVGSINAGAAAVDNSSIGSSSSSVMGFYWGGGAEYFFTCNLAANVQYAKAQGNSNTGSPSLLSAGLSFILQ